MKTGIKSWPQCIGWYFSGLEWHREFGQVWTQWQSKRSTLRGDSDLESEESSWGWTSRWDRLYLLIPHRGTVGFRSQVSISVVVVLVVVFRYLEIFHFNHFKWCNSFAFLHATVIKSDLTWAHTYIDSFLLEWHLRACVCMWMCMCMHISVCPFGSYGSLVINVVWNNVHYGIIHLNKPKFHTNKVALW